MRILLLSLFIEKQTNLGYVFLFFFDQQSKQLLPPFLPKQLSLKFNGKGVGTFVAHLVNIFGAWCNWFKFRLGILTQDKRFCHLLYLMHLKFVKMWDEMHDSCCWSDHFCCLKSLIRWHEDQGAWSKLIFFDFNTILFLSISINITEIYISFHLITW